MKTLRHNKMRFGTYVQCIKVKVLLGYIPNYSQIFFLSWQLERSRNVVKSISNYKKIISNLK